MSGNPPGGDPGALRRLAEEQIARSGGESKVPPADMARVVHELKVHQIELEMQNEELREARDELEANVELFVGLYEFAPVAYFSVTADGMVRRLNFMGASLLGKGRVLVMGCSFTQFVSPPNRRKFDEFLTDVFADKTIEPCEVMLLRDGQAPVVVRLTGSLAPDGQVCRIAAMDVTEQRRVEEAAGEKNEDLDRIFNLSKDLMGTATMDGQLIRLNPAFQELLGYTLQDLKGRAFMDFVHPEDREATRSAVLELRAGRDVIDFVNRQLCHDGSYRWLEWRVTPFRGQFICALGRDITGRKMAEEALQRAQDELELRVQRRTTQLEERTSQLRALASMLTLAEERERRRIARLIHDHLQQMLVAALLNLGLLKTKFPKGAEAADLEMIEQILRDSLETTRSLTTELSPAVLHQCGLAAALKWLRSWCMEKYGLEVAVDAKDGIDPSMDVSVTLFLCVRELLFNIVKHSGVGSAALRMWQSEPGGQLKIEVRDEGSGFDPELVRAREGITGGFGLFNIRERLEILGGGLETESKLGVGSRFTLWVPVCNTTPVPEITALGGSRVMKAMDALPPETAQAVASLAGDSSSRKIRLVVADDHVSVREGLVRIFQSEVDFEVVGQATNGREALQQARQLRPDFVIMDLNMPRMDGLEATAAICGELPDVRVLGLSTHADEAHCAAMVRAGAMDLLHKNSSASALVAFLRMRASKPDRPDT